MDAPTFAIPTKDESLMVDNWPMNLADTRQSLQKAKKHLERYQSALRSASLEIEQRNRSIVALTTLACQANHTTSPTDLLKLALTQAMNTINTSVGAIVLIKPETKELILGVHKGLTPELADILTGKQLENGAAVLMPHLVAGRGALLEYQTADDETEKLLLTTSHLTSLVSLPLQIGPKLIGALLVGRQDEAPFTPIELHFLMALSHETTVALESLGLREGLWHTAETLLDEQAMGVDLRKAVNTISAAESSTFELPATPPPIPQPENEDLEQLLIAMMEAEEEVQQQNNDLQTLNTISEIMNRTLDLKAILQGAVDQTQATLQTDAAWLYLVDDRNQLELQAHTGLSTGFVRGMQNLKLDQGLEGRVVVENKSFFVESIAKDGHKHKIWVDKEKLHALAAVPISRPDFEANTPPEQAPDKSAKRNGSHVVGVLAAGRRTGQDYHWTPRERRLLASIANHVAPAIDNARLYTQVSESQTGLSSGNEVLRAINDMLIEKNAYLESFIEDELTPALTEISQGVQQLLAQNPAALTAEQKQDVARLQEIVDQISELARETSHVSATLDAAFDQALDDEIKQNEYAGTTKPIRLEKREEDGAKRTMSEERGSDGAKPTDSQENGETTIKPMSFEEAMAAGLVPDHIKNRETDEINNPIESQEKKGVP
jgi:GAF domain-containing protein